MWHWRRWKKYIQYFYIIFFCNCWIWWSAKHGNYGVSSACGSSNVLEAIGITFSNDVDHLKHAIETANICVLHAPLFHPAMKNVAPIRKALGIKTFLICLDQWSIHHFQSIKWQFLILNYYDFTIIYINKLTKITVLFMT